MESYIQQLDFISHLWQEFGLSTILVEKKIKKTKSQIFSKNNNTLKTNNDINIPEYGKPPYKYILTYFELYKDIKEFEKLNTPRTKLISSIIKSLNWNVGYVFIPCVYKQKKDIIGYGEIFWKKAIHLKQTHPIKRIIIFGTNCLKPLGLNKKNLRVGISEYMKFPLIILPSPEDMLPDNREAKNITWAFLKKFKNKG